MTPDLMQTPRTTTVTLGELTSAYYEEALREFGDEELAKEISSLLVSEALRRQDVR